MAEPVTECIAASWERLERHALRFADINGDPSDGCSTIEYLLDRGRLERVDAKAPGESSATIVGRAARRRLTADGGMKAGDVEGAFVAGYDAYRIAAEALLVRQGLRATGGEGSHMTVDDAISAQDAQLILGSPSPPSSGFAARVTRRSTSTHPVLSATSPIACVSARSSSMSTPIVVPRWATVRSSVRSSTAVRLTSYR